MTDTATLDALIADLEAATGPSRELDEAIYRYWRKVTPAPRPGVMWTTDLEYAPTYTASLDAALTLVPEGWRVNWAGQTGELHWFFDLIECNGPGQTRRAWHQCYSIALCIAALRARRALATEASDA